MQPVQTVSGGAQQLQGPMMNLLLALAHTMNFTFVLERPPDVSWGTILANGTVTGMVGMVHRQEADFALGPFAFTADRVIIVDYATPLFSVAYHLLGARGRPEVDPWGFLLPFAPSLWAATLGSLGIGVAAAVLLLTTGTQTTRPARERLCSLWQVVLSFVFVYCGILFQQGVEVRPSSKWRRWTGRLMVIGWVCTAMVLAWSYMGCLTSLLAVRHLPQPFQTFDSLGDHPSMLLLVSANSAPAQLVQSGGRAVLQGLEKVREDNRVRPVSRTYHSVYLPMVRGEPWVVLVDELTAVAETERHFSLTGRCDYYTSRETLVSYTYSIILQKKSPLMGAVNARLLALMQGGLYDHWLEAALPNATYCRHSPSTITVQDTLSLTNLWGVFSVLVGGLVASVLAFVCELIISPHREATK